MGIGGLKLAIAAAGVTASIASGSGPAPAKCSARPPNGLPANGWREARRMLAPQGAAAVRLCWYSSLNSPKRGGLDGSLIVGSTTTTVRRLVADFDELPPAPTGRVFCPMDDGEAVMAHLAYAGGHSVTIIVHLSGCLNALNGDLDRGTNGAPGRRLTALLKQLQPSG